MLDTKVKTITVSSQQLFTSEVPIKCPHCSAFVEPTPLRQTGIAYIESKSVFLITFKANCCGNIFFCTYLRDSNSPSNAQLLITYPQTKSYSFSEAINEISLRFIDLYNQAHYAESLNHFELAGSGYRNSMEVLIKDYAINILEKPIEEVRKKNLSQSIKEYMPNIRLSTSADVVRVLGNDFTHYERKYEDIDFKILKQYLEIFIKSIETEYLISHPPVPVPRS